MEKFRIFTVVAVLAAVSSCGYVDSAIDDSVAMQEQRGEKGNLITFSLYETEGTKAPTPLTSLSSFKVTAARGPAGSEEAKFSNVTFSSAGGGKFTADGVYWPNSNPNYSFYASNAQMTHTSAGQTVTIASIDLDVVCAYLAPASVKYKEQNALVFNHILARVGKVEFVNTGLVSNVKIIMKYSGSGTYNIRTNTWAAGEQSTKELTATDNANFWTVPGTYEMTLSYKDANGNPQTKKVSQEFTAGKINNITARLDGSVVVKTENIYEAPTFTLGAVSDVPAGGGDSGAPSVTNVGQRKMVRKTFADGRTKEEWTALSNLSYTVKYGKTSPASETACPKYHGNNLGTTAKARTTLGNIYVRVSANGLNTDKSAEVWQQANEESLGTLSATDFSYAPKVSAAGGEASPTVTYELPYSWTSGSSGKYTTGAILAYTTVTDNAGATLNASTGKVSWTANKDAARSEKEKVTVSLKGKSGSKEAVTEQEGDAVSSYEVPIVTLTYAGSPIAYNSTSAISPTLTVKQKVNYVSGKTETLTLSPGDYSVSYSGSVTGLSVNSSTGVVSPSSNAGSTIAGKTEYSTPTISSFSYGNIAYTGGSSSPSISYSQTKTVYTEGRNSTSSRSTTVTARVTAHSKNGSATAGVSQNGDAGVAQTSSSSSADISGASVSYSGSASGFSRSGGTVTAQSNVGSGGGVSYGDPTVTFTSPSTTIGYAGGIVTCNEATYSQTETTAARNSTSSRSISVKATVKINNKSAEKTASCTQNGDPGASSGTRSIISGGTVTYSSSGTGFSNEGRTIKATSNEGADYTNFSDPVITSFSYTTAPSSGGRSAYSIAYSQNKTTGRSATSSRSGKITATVKLNNKTGSASIDFTQNGDVGTAETAPVTSGTPSFTFTMGYTSGATLINNTYTSGYNQGDVKWAANSSTDERSATVYVTLTLNKKSSVKKPAVSKQEGKKYSISVDPTNLTFAYDASGSGAKKTVAVTCPEGDWEISSKPEGWTTTKSSNNILIYPNAANTTSSTKTGTVTVRCKGDNSKTATVNLSQDAPSYEIIVE